MHGLLISRCVMRIFGYVDLTNFETFKNMRYLLPLSGFVEVLLEDKPDLVNSKWNTKSPFTVSETQWRHLAVS